MGTEGTSQKEKKIWIELAVEVPSDLCDIVSEFLISALGRGILIEDIPHSGTEGREIERIRAYLDSTELDSGILTEIEAFIMELPDLESGFPDVKISTNIIEEDWHEGWKAYFKPTRVGKFIVIKPSWENYVPNPRDIVVEIDPGRAFGTGTHPSTSLVIKAMERLWEEQGWLQKEGVGKPRVLDVGTGTGILGITAAKLGASSVLCLDVDTDAVEIARENTYKNHVHHMVSVSLTPLWQIQEEYDVVLANIDRETLLLLSEDLVEKLASPGWLILSGILVEHGESVRRAFTGLGLELKAEDTEGEWLSMVFTHP